MLPLRHVTRHIVIHWTNVSFFQRTGMGRAGRLYCGVVLTYCGGISEERVPALVVLSPGEGKCLRGASDQAEVNKLIFRWEILGGNRMGCLTEWYGQKKGGSGAQRSK